MKKERSQVKSLRHKKLISLLDSDPLISDNALAAELRVSVGTIRLDRDALNLPGLRERTRLMAERASSRLTSMKQEEVLGEIIELEPNRRALSVFAANREFAFRHTNLIADHYIYAQAATLAIAVVREALAIVGAARVQFSQSAYVGEKLTASARVGTHKDNKYVVSVHTRAGDREIFVARFVVTAIEAI
ncbi:MAG: transcription factor FapR [Synergistaceae bacterium]|jgi:acyl-coenzyme A thioesterase PaaI-like protein|nr:transcription factor FapR [Synergistaceae bacterium]